MDPVIPMFGVVESGKGLGLGVVGEYNPGMTEEIDSKIRNLPEVVEYIHKKAIELMHATGSDNFDVWVSTEAGAVKEEGEEGTRTSHWPAEKQRPRAYVGPSNGKGIHEELSEAVLLKAALGMAGQ